MPKGQEAASQAKIKRMMTLMDSMTARPPDTGQDTGGFPACAVTQAAGGDGTDASREPDVSAPCPLRRTPSWTAPTRRSSPRRRAAGPGRRTPPFPDPTHTAAWTVSRLQAEPLLAHPTTHCAEARPRGARRGAPPSLRRGAHRGAPPPPGSARHTLAAPPAATAEQGPSLTAEPPRAAPCAQEYKRLAKMMGKMKGLKMPKKGGMCASPLLRDRRPSLPARARRRCCSRSVVLIRRRRHRHCLRPQVVARAAAQRAADGPRAAAAGAPLLSQLPALPPLRPSTSLLLLPAHLSLASLPTHALPPADAEADGRGGGPPAAHAAARRKGPVVHARGAGRARVGGPRWCWWLLGRQGDETKNHHEPPLVVGRRRRGGGGQQPGRIFLRSEQRNSLRSSCRLARCYCCWLLGKDTRARVWPRPSSCCCSFTSFPPTTTTTRID